MVSDNKENRIDIEDDVYVLVPPKRRYKVRLHIKSVRRGEPVTTVPEECEEEYELTNREKAMQPSPGLHWCLSCDQARIGQTGKCPVCGDRANRKKRR